MKCNWRTFLVRLMLNQKGMSISELMVAVVVSTIVMGGVMVTFNLLNQFNKQSALIVV